MANKKEIDKMFKWWKDSNLDGNDEVGIQRTKKEYEKLLDTIIKATKKYEPYIAEKFGKHLTRKNISGWSMIGRWFDDGNTPLYHWWGVQGNICNNCYREYGQMYYALNCKCLKSSNECKI